MLLIGFEAVRQVAGMRSRMVLVHGYVVLAVNMNTLRKVHILCQFYLVRAFQLNIIIKI